MDRTKERQKRSSYIYHQGIEQHLPSDVAVASVLFSVLFLWRFFNKNSTPKFLTQN